MQKTNGDKLQQRTGARATTAQQRTMAQGYKNGEKVTLTPAQNVALCELLQSGNVSSAAKAAQVSRKTLHVWMRLKSFQDALLQVQNTMLTNASGLYSGMLLESLQVIADGMRDKDMRTRLLAANSFLRCASDLLETSAITNLMARIENDIRANEPAPERSLIVAARRLQTLPEEMPVRKLETLPVRRPEPDEPLVHPPKRNASCGIRIRALPKKTYEDD